MMLLPWRSSARALFRTSKAVSVPSRDMRRASCNSCCVVGGIMTLLISQTAHYTLWSAARFYNEGRAEHSMTTYLHELYAHQEWADAEHWRAFESHPAALADQRRFGSGCIT